MGLPSPYIWTPDFHKCWQSLRSVSHGRATSLAGNQQSLAGKPGLLDHELVWLLRGTLEQVCATSYLQTPHLGNLWSGLQPAEVFES